VNFVRSIFLMVGLLLGMRILAAEFIPLETLTSLPAGVSNNAVSVTSDGDGYRLISALGLGESKGWNDTRSQAYLFNSRTNDWADLQAVPGGQGRLAASAVTVAGRVYLFGGYTVARDGEEKSTPEVYRLNEPDGSWSEYSRMPVPVDDAVILVYQDRYIYLISGWHDLGNVNLVQVLDTQTGSWQQATPFPGAPVFGHSGGITADAMVICDGVAVSHPADGSSRQFISSSECWQGRVDEKNYRRIHWQRLPAHPGKPRYRMAAGGDASDRIWFVGGSDNPYNYDGTGYNDQPSEPEAVIFSYDVANKEWSCHGRLQQATMDHRGLPFHDGWFYVIGGMRAGQKVSNEVFRFQPPPAVEC